MLVLYKEAANAPEVDGGEEIFQIKVENVATPLVQIGVGYDGPLSFEAMRQRPSRRRRANLQFVQTFVQTVGQTPLQQSQVRLGRLYQTLAPASFRNFEAGVLRCTWNFIEDK
jgi:hypothetical protein